ncbi:MAG TPA: Uma2 family endonuclease [Chloroflexota bacterium]|nr:Uma2 family endonuclease [Chloroflexota bacterium]
MAEPHAAVRWTIRDLEGFPYDETKRYEIIDGELFVSTQPHAEHQATLAQCTGALTWWNGQARQGRVFVAPGFIFSESDAVAPDVIWASHERLAAIQGEDGHFYGAPELMVEVLSPGSTNQRRDRDTKLKLYSIYGVREYWIIDWRTQTVAVYRHHEGQLHLLATLTRDDTLTSPLLPGFSVPVAQLFE